MTKDYDEILDSIYHAETREKAKIYFEKYWLDEVEYFERWRLIKDSIFDNRARYLPDLMFKSGFEVFTFVGGDIFASEADLKILLDCMNCSGDEYFAIVQNQNVVIEGWAFTRFKYPINTSWDELMSGGAIGTEHFHNGCKDYFVFGDSGKWGRYVGNSYFKHKNPRAYNPLNIMGFKASYFDIFAKSVEKFQDYESLTIPNVGSSKWVPDSYKKVF